MGKGNEKDSEANKVVIRELEKKNYTLEETIKKLQIELKQTSLNK